MPISLTCPTCGHEYHLSRKLAGKTLRCKLCQGIIQCPTAAHAPEPEPAMAAAAPAARHPSRQPPPFPDQPFDPEPDSPPAAPTLSYASPAAISHERMLAGRICYFITGIGFFLAVLFAIAAMAYMPDNLPQSARSLYTIVVVAVCALIAAFSSIYVVCGIFIRKGRFVPVILALILASLHLLLLLAGFVRGALGALMDGTNTVGIIQLALQALYAAAVAQLIFYLIKILRQPRVSLR